MLVFRDNELRLVQGQFVCTQTSVYEVFEDESFCQLVKVELDSQENLNIDALEEPIIPTIEQDRNKETLIKNSPAKESQVIK